MLAGEIIDTTYFVT